MQRQEIYDIVHSHPDIFAISIAQRSPREIDDINLTRATQEAFAESIETLVANNQLEPFEEIYAIVDGKVSPKLYASQRKQSDEEDSEPFKTFSVRPYVDGDANVYTVALSSIIARVARDAMMQELDGQHPEYGFADHSGYGRRDHIEVLHRLGSLEGVHRMSFKQVKGHWWPHDDVVKKYHQSALVVTLMKGKVLPDSEFCDVNHEQEITPRADW